jgi:hypothetical protein
MSKSIGLLEIIFNGLVMALSLAGIIMAIILIVS